MEHIIDEMENNRRLAEKIEKLSVVIGHLAKDGRNKFSNYDYISNEKMVTALRTNCLEYKVSIVPSLVDYTERDFENEKGKMVIRTIVEMNFKIVDLETGFEWNEKFIGAENDTGGKSLAQASTQCTKYFYFKLFNVTSQEETDGDSKTEETTQIRVRSLSQKDARGNLASTPKQWLTPEDYKKVLTLTDKTKVQTWLDYYTTDTHGMKKEFREGIKNHLNNL